jgi:hypothetical protein
MSMFDAAAKSAESGVFSIGGRVEAAAPLPTCQAASDKLAGRPVVRRATVVERVGAPWPLRRADDRRQRRSTLAGGAAAGRRRLKGD